MQIFFPIQYPIRDLQLQASQYVTYKTQNIELAVHIAMDTSNIWLWVWDYDSEFSVPYYSQTIQA